MDFNIWSIALCGLIATALVLNGVNGVPVTTKGPMIGNYTTNPDEISRTSNENASITTALPSSTKDRKRIVLPPRNRSRKKKGRKQHSIDRLMPRVNEQYKYQERVKRTCLNGEFYDFEVKSCHRCKKYCNSEDDMSSCGLECRAYFQQVKTQERLERQNAFTIVLTVSSVILGLALVALIRKIIILQKDSDKWRNKVKNMEERIKEKAPSGDEVNDGSSGDPLIAEESQKSEHDG